MAKITFTSDYNHRWPSRAVTHFKAGWSGTVKREVADAAIALGKATGGGKPARQKSDGDQVRYRRAGDLDGCHSGSDGDRASGNELESARAPGGDDVLAVVVGG